MKRLIIYGSALIATLLAVTTFCSYLIEPKWHRNDEVPQALLARTIDTSLRNFNVSGEKLYSIYLFPGMVRFDTRSEASETDVESHSMQYLDLGVVNVMRWYHDGGFTISWLIPKDPAMRHTVTRLQLWPLLGIFLIPSSAIIVRRFVEWRRRRNGLCHACGYSLEGNISGICPECGLMSPNHQAHGRS